jgi:UDP-N-acetylmuramate dehydrogenase
MSIRDSLIEEFGSFIKENESLKPFTTLKIGGQAEYFLLARDTDTLIRALRFTQKHGVRATVIGGGSNVLIADEGIDGLVIRNISTEIRMVGVSAKRIHGEEQKEVLLEVAAGVPTNSLVRYTADEGLSGLEMHLGLPGTIGGALFMNAKWTIPNLQYISDPLLRVELLTKKGELITVDKSYFNFDYNYSKIQETGDSCGEAEYWGGGEYCCF